MTGEELRQLRTALGLTQTQLAEAISVSLNTVSRWETGSVPIPHPGMLSLALEALEARALMVVDDRLLMRYAEWPVETDTPESIDQKMRAATGIVNRLAYHLQGPNTPNDE